MRRWFLSYHSPDQALAERLKAAVERKDSDSKVFFAPTSLRAGGSWSTQLAEEIATASAFILLVGERGVGDWQVLEYDEALDKHITSPDFPLIVVLLDGQTAPGLPFLRRLHWIVSADPTCEKDLARLFDAASGQGASPGELWRYTSPYRGLAAMEEKDSDYFFGRERETVRVLSALAGAPNRLPILIGNSGVGKSSLAQAGVLAALKRQAWPDDVGAPNSWPAAFLNSRQWCFLTLKPGADPLKALVEPFLDTWQFAPTAPERVEHQHGWIELLLARKATLSDLIDATERRRKQLDQPTPPVSFLYIDQGEELYIRADETRRRRFSELIVEALCDPRLRIMMSMRSDFLGHLQNDEPLFNIRQQVDVPPLRESQLREVVGRPAQLLSARFETDGLVDIITQRTAEESIKDVGALPLLSYTLDDMWSGMVRRADGTLRLPAQSFELGGVLVDRADKFLDAHPGAEDALRRVLTLRLATVREDGEPARRRAARDEFADDEWRLASELADYPNRLLVTVTTEAGDTYAEVAHEAIFRRWTKLRDWIAAERDFLYWRSRLESAIRAWKAAPDTSKSGALLMGFALEEGSRWLASRSQDLASAEKDFIVQSRRATRRRRLRGQLLVGGLVGVIFVSLAAWRFQQTLRENLYWVVNVRGFALAQASESKLKPKDVFKECADCPDMVVVPPGAFMMGSSDKDEDAADSERPQHKVAIIKSFAISRFELTFDEWDACVGAGGCNDYKPFDQGWGRARRPVINVSWNDAQLYLAWLRKITGKDYRLLTEAEFEYAARAGSATTYYWGDPIGKNNANCDGCGSQWDNRQTAPVGSFMPNAFGLYDMTGNIYQWTEDCWHDDYNGAPSDGSAWTAGDGCSSRVVRGGSWGDLPEILRSAYRFKASTLMRDYSAGFRIARTLAP